MDTDSRHEALWLWQLLGKVAAACAIVALFALGADAQAQFYCCVCITGADCVSAPCDQACVKVADEAACDAFCASFEWAPVAPRHLRSE